MKDPRDPQDGEPRGGEALRGGEADTPAYRSVPVADALRESEERFRALTEHARDAIVEITPDAKILYVNPSFTDIYGWTVDEIVDTNAFELIHPEDAQEVDAIRRSAFAEGASAHLRFRFLHRSGDWRWAELAGRPYRTSSGEPRGVIVARDITDRVQAEQALQEQLDTERRIADVSRSFINVEREGFDACVRDGLAAAAQLAGADRAQFYLVPEPGGAIGGRYQWSAEDVHELDPGDASRFVRRFPWSASKLLGGEILHVPNVAELPAEAAAERAGLEADGTHSYLAIPLVQDGLTVGFLDLFRLREQRGWSDVEIARLQLVAEVLIGAVRRLSAEEERRRAEERFRELTRHVRDTICEMSMEGRILHMSDNFEDLCGYTPSELENMDPWSLVHPDDLERTRREASDAVRCDSGEGRLTYRTRHRNGTWRWLEATMRPFDAGSGERHIALVIRDVTARQERSIALESELDLEKGVTDFSRALLERGADQVDAGIEHGLELAARIAGADRGYLVTAFGSDEPRARVYDWVAPGVSPRQHKLGIGQRKQAWIMERLQRGELVRVPRVEELPDEARAIRESLQEGGIRSYLCIPINSDTGLLGVLGFHCLKQQKDWSEREVTLLRLVADLFTSALRRKRAEVGLQESQQRLLQAQKMEAVGTLAGGIAHDFNNQLTVMLANARFALREAKDADDDVRQALEDLNRAANHCAQLTRSLLHFSRRTTASPRPLDVAEVVSDAEELLRPLIPSSIVFALERPSEPARIMADPTQLQQVLVNLVVNARDAMPEGGRLSLRAACVELDADEARRFGLAQPGSYVQFAVRDTGTGMDRETLERLFEPFFTTKPVGQGTGLGLATAYGIVEQFGGAIAAESEPGRGSIFRVLLRRTSRGVSDAREAGSARAVPTGGTVLLAEDEESVRRLVARALEDAGYRVLAAPDGAEALRLGRQHPVDVLVTDVDMPRLGGVELARRLARQRAELPVLFISGTSQEDLAVGDPEAPVERLRFLAKPFSDSALLQALGELLSS